MEEFIGSLPAPGRIPTFCKGSPAQGLSVFPAAPQSAAQHGDAAPGPAAASGWRTQRVRCRVLGELPQSAGPQQHSKAQAGDGSRFVLRPMLLPLAPSHLLTPGICQLQLRAAFKGWLLHLCCATCWLAGLSRKEQQSKPGACRLSHCRHRPAPNKAPSTLSPAPWG